MPTESSPEVSWLQTNSSKTTTPLKTTASSISITTPTNNPQQFPSHIKNLPDFSSTTHIKSNLLNKYDTKIHNLQSKIIHNEQNYNLDRQIFENAQKTLLANAELEIQRLKEDLSASSKKYDSIKSENKKFKTELVSLKSEMQLLGSDPVDDTVINDMKRRGNLTVRQVAEIRLHTILKPILLDLEGKNRQVEKLFEKCQGFEQLCEDNKVSVDSVTKMKSGYQEQLTRNRIELMDCRNQLTKYENLSTQFNQNEIKLKAASDQITSLTAQLSDAQASSKQELSYRIKAEKELAVVTEQLNMITSDKKYLEASTLANTSKIHQLEGDLSTSWKEIEGLKMKNSLLQQDKIRLETSAIELKTRIERSEKELLQSRQLLTHTDQFNKEISLRAQHDTDIVHEKLSHIVTAKNLVEEENRKLNLQVLENKEESIRLKNIYDKDLKIMEQNLLEAERRAEIYMSEKLKEASQKQKYEADVLTLQNQLQILFSKVTNSEEKYNHLLEHTNKLNASEFDVTSLDIPGIDDLEQALHDRPYATAILLAKRIYQLQGHLSTTELKNQLSRDNFSKKSGNTTSNLKKKKLEKLKQTNESLLKKDLQDLLSLNSQVGKMRGILSQLMKMEGGSKNEQEMIKKASLAYQQLESSTKQQNSESRNKVSHVISSDSNFEEEIVEEPIYQEYVTEVIHG